MGRPRCRSRARRACRARSSRRPATLSPDCSSRRAMTELHNELLFIISPFSLSAHSAAL